MNFYISKIRLWFRNGAKPRDLEFYEDKVNVITGDSSTGKSSVLKIIDYCLLEERCSIVQDVINENVSWYGMVFYIDGKSFTIVRKAPKVEEIEMVVIFREGEYLPDVPEANIDDLRPKALVKMNELFHIPTKVKLDSKIRLNFRHYLLFNYLTEDIIATESMYQDFSFFKSNEYVKVREDLFKMVIGVDEAKMMELTSELKSAEEKNNRLKKKQETEIEELQKLQKTRDEISKEIEDLKLGDVTMLAHDTYAWSSAIKSIVDQVRLQFFDEQANRRRNELTAELQDLSERLGYYESLEKEYKSYLDRLKRQSDSLVPLDYLKKHVGELLYYQETGLLIKELSEAWQSIKDSYTPEVKLPDDFEMRRTELKKRQRELSQEIKKLNPYQPDKRDMRWVSKAVLLANRIEKELAVTPKQTVTDEKLVECSQNITSINERLIRLRAKNDNAIGSLNNAIWKFFKYQNGISDSYKDCKPIYSTDLNMLMLERNPDEYPIANVGSKSNYMFLHLCYFFGLHDLMMENRNEQTAHFMFIDQPSIPYYADKNERSRDESDENMSNDDQVKLRNAFQLTDKFMREMVRKGHFQIIMVEHAREEYWQDLETFATCYHFTRQEGLIPSYVLNKD